MKKDELLSKVSVQQIYTKFYEGEFSTTKNVSSPFSDDKKASFRFYKNGTFKCFSSGNQGDVFQFVSDLKEIDCKSQFDQVLDVICQEFSLNGYSNSTQITKPKTSKTPSKEVEKNKDFSFKTKALEQFHLDYFNQKNWNVSKEILDKYNVSALDKFQFFNSNKKEISKIKLFNGVLGFAYQVNDNVELYIPKQAKTTKFFYNQLSNDDIFGFAQLPKNPEQIFISAGKKDCLILNANGFPAITFRSENHFVTEEQIKLLRKKCDSIIVCYDNDKPGQEAAQRIVEKFNLNLISLPQEINDIADFFLVKTKNDFQEILNNTLLFSDKKPTKKEPENIEEHKKTIFHVVEDYLSKKYHFRFNTILLDVQYKPKRSKQDWKICNEDSLFIEMQKKSINIQMAKLISILKSDFVPEYNPIHFYFKNLKKWDGKDYISELVNYVSTPDKKEFAYHLTKWMARAVKCMLIDGYFNKQAFIITDKGNGQNIGKSHLTKWLCPPTLPLNRSFEDSKKDNLIKLATNAFIILDELDGISRKDLNGLKALFSMDEIRVRLPYARREQTVQRTANFIGSTNEEDFLSDPTGSVRWLVFDVTAINWEYSKKLDINDLWSQAFALAKDINFDESFSKDDVKNNELRNETYQIRTPETEIISLLFELPTDKTQKKMKFLTSTEILIFIKANSALNRLSPVSVGRALKLLNFKRIKSKGVYGYYVVFTNKTLGTDSNVFE